MGLQEACERDAESERIGKESRESRMPNEIARGGIWKSYWMLVFREIMYLYLSNSFYIVS